MALKDFNGKTFVAFIDISGFKEMMKNGTAARALDCFYQNGYELLNDSKYNKISGIFVSDCGIIYSNENSGNIENKLYTILNFIKDINKTMLRESFLLTTSVCYGDFQYEKRIELRNMSKNALVGNAYLDAYKDNECTTPKIKAGECRIVINDELKSLDKLFVNDMKLEQRTNHYYYHYLLNDEQEITSYKNSMKEIEQEYEAEIKNNTNNKFERIKSTMRRYLN